MGDRGKKDKEKVNKQHGMKEQQKEREKIAKQVKKA